MKLGPITIMTTKKADAYEEVHTQAGMLHQELWFSEDWTRDREKIMVDVMFLGEALSHLPDFYYD